MRSLDDVDIVLNPGDEIWREIALQASATEGWSITWSNHEMWRQGFKNFWFYAAIEKDTKKFVASVTLAQDHHLEGQGELFSVGAYYCSPDWRGSGVGTKLFSMIMDIAGDENVTLYGGMKMAPRYASKFGFDKWPKHAHNCATILTEDFVNIGGVDGISTKPLSDVPWDSIVGYDRTIFPRERSVFLKKWMSGLYTNTKVAFDSSGTIVGFCCVREDVSGNLRIGPLYADSKDVAQTLLSSSLSSIDLQKFKEIYLSYPEVNKDCTSLISKFSGGKGSSTPDMQSQFTKYVIETTNEKVYSISESASSIV